MNVILFCHREHSFDVHPSFFAVHDSIINHGEILRDFSGADPENFHGRWLTGWLPIVNHTGAKGVAG